MLRNSGIHIWPAGPVSTTGSNTTNILLDSPITSTVTGGNVYLDFTSNGALVDHLAMPITVQPGPMVVLPCSSGPPKKSWKS